MLLDQWVQETAVVSTETDRPTDCRKPSPDKSPNSTRTATSTCLRPVRTLALCRTAVARSHRWAGRPSYQALCTMFLHLSFHPQSGAHRSGVGFLQPRTAAALLQGIYRACGAGSSAGHVRCRVTPPPLTTNTDISLPLKCWQIAMPVV